MQTSFLKTATKFMDFPFMYLIGRDKEERAKFIYQALKS